MEMFAVLNVVASIAALPLALMGAYLALLSWLARRLAPPPAARRLRMFDVVVPAHNEEATVGDTVRSLLAVEYPLYAYRVRVVADNCTDATAERAAAAGADVLVRTDPRMKGKGHALAFAFNRSLADGFADAIVVVDADSSVSPNLLAAFAARFDQGEAALQADYGVRNATSSWRTRLMHIAFTAFHTVRSLARERMGVSCGLRGNGMAFTTDVLRAVPHSAFSVVEDVEYGIALALANLRVAYVAEAEVVGDMCQAEVNSRSQRQRWEHGRALLRRQHAWSLLTKGITRRSPMLLDLAADLLLPPLGQLTVFVAIGLTLSGAGVIAGYPVRIALLLCAAAGAGVACYAARSVALSGAGIRGVADLAYAPLYMFWKLTLPFRASGARASEWVRTTREAGVERSGR